MVEEKTEVRLNVAGIIEALGGEREVRAAISRLNMEQPAGSTVYVWSHTNKISVKSLLTLMTVSTVIGRRIDLYDFIDINYVETTSFGAASGATFEGSLAGFRKEVKAQGEAK